MPNMPKKLCRIELGETRAEFLLMDEKGESLGRELLDIPDHGLFCQELVKAIRRKLEEGWEVRVEPANLKSRGGVKTKNCSSKMTEEKRVIENVKKVRLDIKRGDLSFYGPGGELVLRIPNAYQIGLSEISFDDANVRLERDMLEADFPQPVTCKIYERKIVCSK